ncbi:hypothetical protein D3C87_2098290 [compost metagenome]
MRRLDVAAGALRSRITGDTRNEVAFEGDTYKPASNAAAKVKRRMCDPPFGDQ